MDIKEQVKQQVNIVDLIAESVELESNGNRLRGMCPFHEDSKPSFYVYPETQSFNCFGCQKSGDVISFIKLKYNLGFREALQFLIDKYQLPFTLENGKYQDWYADLERIQELFVMNLSNSPAYDYISNRKFNPEDIRRFGFGYGTYQTYQQLSGRFGQSRLKQLGIMGQSGAQLFANRLTIPLKNEYGRVVSFTGREITNTGFKYINGASTPIFEKTSYLYLLDQASKPIKQTGFVIVVEGNMDAIRMHTAGITNTVAIMGTYLTEEHMATLGKITNRIILLFDNDKAGIKAIEQSYKNTLPDLFLLVAQVEAQEEAKDPDEYILKYGDNHATDLIEHAQPIELFLINSYAHNYDLSHPVGKDLFLKAVKEILRQTSDHSKMGTYSNCVKRISELTGIKEETLYRINEETQNSVLTLMQEERELFDYYFRYCENPPNIQAPSFEQLPATLQIKLLNYLENSLKQ